MMTGEAQEFVDTIISLSRDGERVPQHVINQLISAWNADMYRIVREQSSQIADLKTSVKLLVDYQERHPPIIWLLRFKTKQTITAIIVILALLGTIYISGIRVPFFEWLGLPPLR